MPMWIVHAPAGVYSTEDKKNLTEIITQFYVDTVALPKFYVVVRFDEYPVDSMWVGGQPVNDFVRVVVDHIARQMDDPAIRELCMSMLSERFAPFTTDRGLHTEIHLDETPIDLWRVDGIKPPRPESEAEKKWARDNAPSPYELADAG
ncbi:tautomerase family protein [Smaragdicoccus niigatensis]|uniref:tautomerase family protein n=2 Tax=Smaragdicoccus niigatensis TaxID=359359 RepID=UPI0004766E70|nr:tautomerase family protein [Smaragdicoccus niigatensis]